MCDNMSVNLQGQENKGYDKSADHNTTIPPTQTADVSDIQIEDDDLPCKWGPLTSHCCNVFRSPKVVLLVLCLGVSVQGMMVNGFVNVNISTWERRFELRSTETGLVVSCYDIAVVLCLIPVTYFGGLGSKPRWLGWGFIILGVAAVVCSVPHFVTEEYQYSSSSTDTPGYCGVLNNTESVVREACTRQRTSLNNYKYVFILGMLLFGVGASPLYTLGVTYMDENVKQKWLSMYIGIFYTMAVIGPAVGFVLGGYFLRFYTDFDVIDTSTLQITEGNVAWIGAWWLGFLIFGGVSVMIGVIMLGFPERLPGAMRLRADRVSEAHRGEQGVTVHTAGFGSLKNLPKSLKVLLINPTFMLLNLAGAAEGIVVQGVATFIPKYVEYQFSVTASYAAFLIGIGTVVGGGLGTFLSGYIIKKMKLSLPGLLKMCMICCAVATVGQLGFLAKCSTVSFAGISHTYNDTVIENQAMGEDTLIASCNQHCGCANLVFDPVCGDNGIMYFTACAAGCQNHTQEETGKIYANCSCVEMGSDTGESVSQSATEGRCPVNCRLIIVFMVIFVIVLLFSFATGISELSATLRSVPEPQRSLSLGVQWIIVRCLGNIPGPVLYGTIIDQACLYWHQPCDNSTEGACYFYNNNQLSYYVLAITVGCKVVALVFYVLAWLVYKPPPQDNTKDMNQ